jgi:hypothetical protein
MKPSFSIYFATAVILGTCRSMADDASAKVTEAVNIVEHGPQGTTDYSPARQGTPVHDGEQLKTGERSRAEMKLPNLTITRLGADTIYNYSAGSNTIDLQEGDILFCKPKDARQLNIKTAAVTAGITGTTGFVSVRGSGSKKTYIFGIIEGHAKATADGKNYSVGAGDILEFKPGSKPFTFAFDVPRFVKSSALLNRFKGTLPNQSAIDAELFNYQAMVSRGFIEPPSHAIDYSGDIPILSRPAYDSAQNSQGAKAPPPPPPKYPFSPKGGGT